MLKGIDVSHYNNDRGLIDWDQVKTNGYDFAMIKLTEGRNYVDPKHEENVHNAKKHEFLVGGYHYAHFQNVREAKREAAFFKSIAGSHKLDYAILDIEFPEANGDLTFEAAAFMDEISDLAKPLLYSYPNWIQHHFSEEINKYPLWIAHYGVKSPDIQPWEEWQVWQHSSTGRVKGMAGDVDEDVMKPGFAVNKSRSKIHPKLSESTGTYTIQKGDTFWGLEEKWGLQHGTLAVLNPNVNPRKLSIGQKIHVPRNVKQHSEVYKIRPGDTLSEIAVKHHTTVRALMHMNPEIKDADRIFAGEKISIPK